MNYCGDSAARGMAGYFGGGCLAQAEGLLQALQRDGLANLAAMPKAIGNGFGHAENFHGDFLDRNGDDIIRGEPGLRTGHGNLILCACKYIHCSYNQPMDWLDFEWDVNKDAANQRKHGVSFEEAETAFIDEHARLIADPDHSEEEARFILLGMSRQFRLLVVCHCVRNEDRIRIISARRANQSERNSYEGYRNA